MVPDKFNMVDMGGIDLIMMQGEEVPGLYNRLVESIAQCRYQCLYNWLFDGVIIPPTYVELEVNENDEVAINEGVTVTEDDVIHIYSIEPPAPEPEIIPLLAEENGVYSVPAGKDGFNPVTVDVPSYTPVINPITITENGTYNVPAGVDGYAPVVVNVEGGATLTELFKANDYSGVPVTDVILSDEANNYSMLIINPVFVYGVDNYTYAMIMSEPGYGNWYVGINVSGSAYLNIGLNSDLKSFFVKSSSAINRIYSVYGI